MKTFQLTICNKLKDVTVTVKNYRKFEKAMMLKEYHNFNIVIAEPDIKRVKQYAVKNADDRSSNKGHWYVHCNGYSMGLFINYEGSATVNTYYR